MTGRKNQKNRIIVMNSLTRNFVVGIMVLACLVLLGMCGYVVLRNVGKHGIYEQNKVVNLDQLTENLSDVVPTAPPAEPDSVITEDYHVTELEEGQIYYNGEVWQYNQDIMTFLCLGIDSRSGITDEKVPGNAGQSDAIVLFVANPHTKQVKVINVNRDSMVEIKRYDTDGNYIGVMEGQLTLQYAYGDGRTESCEMTKEAVSELFYGIPIHGYMALDMKSIGDINDSVGGVEVTVLEDMTWVNKAWTKGKTVLLKGEDALKYIQRRNHTSSELGTNLNRIARQKQYLTLFADKLKAKMKENITFPVTLYGKVQEHLVTSFSLDQITYLAGELLDYDVSLDGIVSLSGESVMGEKYEEFYVDEIALKELIITTFYEKVFE